MKGFSYNNNREWALGHEGDDGQARARFRPLVRLFIFFRELGRKIFQKISCA